MNTINFDNPKFDTACWIVMVLAAVYFIGRIVVSILFNV